MKKILFALLITSCLAAKAQVYNNEWIDYTKTYYKFKVGKTGLFRIPQSVLFSAGLSVVPAEHFQLWRNGVQVPIYTSTPAGTFSSSDYIEFWGLMNDGKPDRELYRDPSYQLNDKWSLETDTASYFLTINTNSSQNKRLVTTINNVSGNTLPAEPYFMHTMGNYFRYRVIRDTLINGNLVNDTLINYPMQQMPRPRPGNTDKDVYIYKLNQGFAVNVGEYLYSSSYDKGEGFSSTDLVSQSYGDGSVLKGVNSLLFKNLYVAPSGPTPKFKIAASGNANNKRRFTVHINSDSVFGRQLDFFNFINDSTNFPLSLIQGGSANVVITNVSDIQCYPAPVGCQTDRMVVNKYEIIYPRLFNFGGQSNFEFTLPAGPSGNFLQISNFNHGSSIPVLYDLTNGVRYVANMDAAPVLNFALEPSSVSRQLVLVSEEASNVSLVTGLEVRNFVNYTMPSAQGDYLIISHPHMFTGPNGSNPVAEYMQYRNSAPGGSYNSKIYLIDEIIDQFGYGIKKNPAGLRNFLRYARHHYTIPPKFVFIIGRGVNYADHRNFEISSTDLAKLDFIPPYGRPASDILFTAEPGSSQPRTPIGRISVINGQEVAVYLKKVKEFEIVNATQSGVIADKSWTKNFVHLIGASDPGLDTQLTQNMRRYEFIIRDTLMGAEVSTFSKSSNNFQEQLNSTRLTNLFAEGINVITYFGHSSSSTIEFNLDNPQNYNNNQKYPLFIGLGCNAGDFFKYTPNRLVTKETLSEKWVLAPDRGTIGFIASTHFGIVHYLDIWASRAYQEIAYKSYGLTLGEIMKNTAQAVFDFTTEEDFYARCNTEQSELHGDPAVRMNAQPKPDYAIEASLVRSIPGFVSVGDQSFRINARIMNLGKAVDSSIVIEVKRELPDQSVSIVFRDTIPGIRYSDTIGFPLTILSSHKGVNKFTITVDVDGRIDEMFENNNSVVKDIMIYEDEARPIYPYNYAIINQQNIKFIASTADPFSVSKQYIMEIDTTELFNSPIKVANTITSAGGTMEFNPGIVFTDSTVYYWRVAPVTNNVTVWNTASFIYLPSSEVGFNQSHAHQHLKSGMQGIEYDSTSRQWKFGDRYQNLFVKHGSWVTSTGQEGGLSVAVNDDPSIRNTCYFQSVVFNVFDPITFKPWVNTTLQTAAAYPPVGQGLYGSAANNCSFTRRHNFEFRWDTTLSRKRAIDFMEDTIPDGAYVVVRSFLLDPVAFAANASLIRYAYQWKSADEAAYGPGVSLYHAFKNAGFTDIDSFNRPRQFVLIYKKNDPSFIPKWVFSESTVDNISISADCVVPDTLGKISSPKFGPSKQWKEVIWDGAAMENVPGDNPRVSVIGVRYDGTSDTVMAGLNVTQQAIDISSVNALEFPFIVLHMKNADPLNNTPFQMRYWRVTYDPAPEGAIAPNAFFSMNKDTVDVAEPILFSIAFKNISPIPFTDSVKVKMVLTDHKNVMHDLGSVRYKPLGVDDTLHIHCPIDTRLIPGSNALFVEVNPDNDQPEQYHFNNFAYKSFYVHADSLNPILDVTFDNVHILNHDIVSARPNIVIKLKDEARWFRMDDPEKLKVKIKTLPKSSTGTTLIREYPFDGDTLQFIPATQATDNNNTASAIFKPHFLEDGKYELSVTGKDMSENGAGDMEYRVTFEVINKPMISNMLNYPNPFTTSTAFVFTLTGSEVPQNIKIQVLTITGKVVREITKEELGPLRIGRNITEFKWDGTDQYGQKLANGVYLYRVVTNLNGKSLDKYTSKYDETDQYFNKGYGKMYLMR